MKFPATRVANSTRADKKTPLIPLPEMTLPLMVFDGAPLTVIPLFALPMASLPELSVPMLLSESRSDWPPRHSERCR